MCLQPGQGLDAPDNRKPPLPGTVRFSTQLSPQGHSPDICYGEFLLCLFQNVHNTIAYELLPWRIGRWTTLSLFIICSSENLTVELVWFDASIVNWIPLNIDGWIKSREMRRHQKLSHLFGDWLQTRLRLPRHAPIVNWLNQDLRVRRLGIFPT